MVTGVLLRAEPLAACVTHAITTNCMTACPSFLGRETVFVAAVRAFHSTIHEI